MQAPVFKRTTLNQVVGLALAVGLAASVTLNVVMLTRSNDGASQPVAAQSIAAAQASDSAANTSQIDVDQFLADQSVAAAQASYSAANTSQIDVDQFLAGQRVAVAQASYSAANTSQIDVDQLLANQRFAPTAMDRFIIAAGQ